MKEFELLHKFVQANRKHRMESSDQLTLGKLIEKLKPIVAKQKEIIKKYQSEALIQYDFEYCYPTHFDSWRGSYNELSLNICLGGYKKEEQEKELTVSGFLKMCEETIGKTFQGWKGGDFKMDEDTPIWIANSGNSGETALIDVYDNEYSVILMTGQREY